MRAALVLLSLAPLASADVRVVSPTGPFTQIQAAVNAANDGDLVLVKAGTYSGFLIQAKSLTVVGDANPLVTVQGAARVTDLAPGQTVSLIRLNATGATTGAASAHVGFYSNNNQGSVRCQGCNFVGADLDASHADGYDAAWIDSSSDVSLVACTVYGGAGGPDDKPTPVGGCGVRSQSSTLTFFDCTINGGVGEMSGSTIGQSGNGGQGMHAVSCTVFSSNTSFVGGAGGFGAIQGLIGPLPGLGGAGVELVPVSSMTSIASSMVGGVNGNFWQTGGGGPSTLGGSFLVLSGTKRTMTGANPVRELTPLSFSLHGAPGENVYLLVGLETGLQWDPAHEANFLLASPFRTLPVGTTNGSGNLSISLPLSDLGAGVQSEMFYLQPLFVGPGGAQQLGTPITLAALDQAF